MKDNFELDGNEKVLTIKALNLLRNHLSIHQRSTDVMDDLIIKISGDSKKMLDKYETGIMINALNCMRYKLKKQNESCLEVNRLLFRIMNEADRKGLFQER